MEIDLSRLGVRSNYVVEELGVQTPQELSEYFEGQILKIRYGGEKVLTELREEVLEPSGLRFKIDGYDK